jgi:hypothetical protein
MMNDKCTLVLPRENLVNGSDNEEYYYGRMADELIRYNRIKSFIFKPNSYLSFGNVKYNLRDDEMIILQDMLTQEFFENLVPADINKFAKYNTYDTAEPIVSQTYNKNIKLDEEDKPEPTCIPSDPKPITSEYLRKCFPENYKEVEYTRSKQCSLQLIKDVVKRVNGVELTIAQIKDDLIEEYSTLTNQFTNKDRIDRIVDVLKEEVQIDATELQDGTISFEQMILLHGFVAINFDLWLLLVRYKIPSIFMSSKPIPESRYNSNDFVCYKDPSNSSQFVFIISPAMYKRSGQKIPQYKLVVNSAEPDQLYINIQNLTCRPMLQEAIDKYYTVTYYLDSVFKKDVKTKYKPKQKGMRDVVFDVVEAPVTVVETQSKMKPLQSTIVLQDEEGDKPEEEITELLLPQAITNVVKPRKTRKVRERKLVVNPPGKRGSRKKLTDSVEIIENI